MLEHNYKFNICIHQFHIYSLHILGGRKIELSKSTSRSKHKYIVQHNSHKKKGKKKTKKTSYRFT